MAFDIMTITDAAASRISEIVATRPGEARGIRVSVKKGGCAGMEYAVDLVTEPDPKDDHVVKGDVHVWIAPEAVLYLLGTSLDYEVTTLRSGFTFQNPNQVSACGCGESVELKAADLAALARQKLEASAGA